MAGLDVFHGLPVSQRIGVIAGVGVLIACVLVYFLSSALDELGPDEDNMLEFMLHNEAEGSIWGEIITLRAATAKDKKVAETLDSRKLMLEELRGKIIESQERLPTESEKGKIIEEISQFVRDINALDACELYVSSVKIDERSSRPTRGKKNKKAMPVKTTFKCTLSGDINGIISFVNKVELSPRFMTVDGLKIKPGKVSLDTEKELIAGGLHSVNIEVNTWVLPEL